MRFSKKKNNTSRPTLRAPRPQGGYTLFELAIVLFIILTITMVSRTNKATYERSFILSNLAYDVALTLREAQVYGINTRQANAGANPSSFDIGYGVYFTNNSTNLALFVDLNNNRAYDAATDAIIRTYEIRNNNTISSLCVVPAGGGGCSTNTSLTITYRRPDPDACINPNNTTPGGSLKTVSQCQAQFNNREARITVQSPRGETRVITVYSTGQVTVQ